MSERMICLRCGSIGETYIANHGSLLIECALWLTFLVPGIFYTMWRFSTRHHVCGVCDSEDLVPPCSPRGRDILAKMARTTNE